MKIEICADQTLLDIAMQYYGTAEGVGEILRNNPQLKNDPMRLAAEGRSMNVFYPDLRLDPGQTVLIAESSELLRKSVVKKIDKKVTTYMTKEWQEQLMR